MYIDLQLHSTYSDGYLTPSQLVSFLLANKIKVAALTDHNTIAGINEFKEACRKNHIKPLVGLELYAMLGSRRFNLLWYNFSDQSQELNKMLLLSQERRRRQLRRMLLKLARRGFKINQEKIFHKYKNYIPLNKIIDELRQIPKNRRLIIKKTGLHPRENDIISKFFRNPKIGRLNESYIGFSNIIKLRSKIGGQLILNHPGKHDRLDKNFIARLKKIGLDGMEVISPHHTIGVVMYAQSLAKTYKLIMTGGSDFHRQESRAVKIKSCYDYFNVDAKNLLKIERIIG